MNKVYGGTPSGSKTLCETCRRAHKITGLNFQHVVYCNAQSPPLQLTFPVEQCSLYDDKRKPSLYWMEEVAWNVVSRKRGPTGFTGDESKADIYIEPPQNPHQPSQNPPMEGNEPNEHN